jgi:hypothetical protein
MDWIGTGGEGGSGGRQHVGCYLSCCVYFQDVLSGIQNHLWVCFTSLG